MRQREAQAAEVVTRESNPLSELLAQPYKPPAETRRAKPLPARLRPPKPEPEPEPDSYS